jgi:long-chain fatty acid transport protein
MRTPRWTLRARLAVLALVGLCPAAYAASPTPTAVPTPNLEDEFAFPSVRFSLSDGSGARALGMGGAFIARPDDASAATWNPAGLSYLRRPEVSAAGMRAKGSSRAVSSDNAQTQTYELRSFNPDFLAAAYPLSFGEVTGAAQLSFQRVIPFAGRQEIARGSEGAQVQLDASGGFDVFAAGLGVQLSRKVRVGATVNRWTNGYSVTLERTLFRPAVRKSKLDLSGINFNLGVIVSPWDDLNIGFVGKTPFTGATSLDRSRVDFPQRSTGSGNQLADGSVTSTTNAAFRDDLRLHMPGAVGMGVSWRAATSLTLSLDVTRTFWSRSTIENFFQIAPSGPPQTFARAPFPTFQGPEQTDAQQLRAGVEYVLVGSRLKWPFRIGYINDQQYFQAIDGAPRFNAVTFGTGVLAGHFLFDIAYVYEHGRFSEADSFGQPGLRWTTNSHRFFGSLIYRFSE